MWAVLMKRCLHAQCMLSNSISCPSWCSGSQTNRTDQYLICSLRYQTVCVCVWQGNESKGWDLLICGILKIILRCRKWVSLLRGFWAVGRADMTWFSSRRVCGSYSAACWKRHSLWFLCYTGCTHSSEPQGRWRTNQPLEHSLAAGWSHTSSPWSYRCSGSVVPLSYGTLSPEN